MRSRKNKRTMFFRKSTWLLIVIFIATLITIPSFNITEVKADIRTIETEDPNVIKVLNIDPGAANTTLTSGTQTVSIKDSNGNSITKQANVTCMDMAEFISKVDEVKGQFDIVVVGRNKTDLSQNFDYLKQYRDYSAPFSQEFSAQNAKEMTRAGVYFTKPDTGWGEPKAYVYDNTNANNKNAAWPGVSMTSIGNNIYYYEVPTTIANARVTITDGTNQIPAKAQPGYSYTTGTVLVWNGSNWLQNKAGLYFTKPASWATAKVYVYDDSTSPTTMNVAWPGEAMTDKGNGQYYYEVPASIKNPKVIFTDGGSQQIPAKDQPGHVYTAGTALTYDGTNWVQDWENPGLKIKYSSPSEVSTLKYSGFTESNKTIVEYYSENDITVKRSKEIKAMLDNNELVYFADEIFVPDLQNSNLYKQFIPYINEQIADSTKYPNLQTEPQANLKIQTIIEYYNNNISDDLKRPQITSFTVSDDDQVDAANTNLKNSLGISEVWKGIPANRHMTFTFQIPDADNYKARIYLDLDSDGRFIEKGSLIDLKEFKSKTTQNEYTISTDLANDFIGYLDWKVEITKPDGVKTFVIGNSIFKPLVTQKKIKVLQIFPNVSAIDDTKNLYVSEMDGKDTVAKEAFNNKVKMPKVTESGYVLDIDAMSCTAFNTAISGNPDYLNTNIVNDINTTAYDMIIVGFADNYGGDDEFADNAVNAIELFMKLPGKTAMLTHDTMALNVFGSGITKTGPKLLGQKLRDYLGQARYSDMYRAGVETDLNVTKTIPHDTLPGNSSEPGVKDKYSMGATLYSNKYTSTLTTSVKSVNKAQISSYPFNLSSNIPVALTHSQWYQLNLEDEDVVPWYNLSSTSNNFDSGDSRNYYYTYSKGNITYSGTGHTTDGSYSSEELELFVNTIIKASRGANNEPGIINKTTEKVTIADGATVATPVQTTGNYKFITIPTDSDMKGLKVKVTVGTVGTVGTDIIINDTGYIRSDGEEIPVTIDNNYFAKKNDGDILKVESTVEDESGIKKSSSFFLKVNKAPEVPEVITHGVLVNELISGVTQVNYFEDIKFRGEITNLVSSNELITLKIDNNLKVKGKVTIQVENAGVFTEPTEMILSAVANEYTYNLSCQGQKIRVNYTAEIYKLPTSNPQSYTNTLKTVDVSKSVTITTTAKTGSQEYF